jgi:hypothetical protein
VTDNVSKGKEIIWFAVWLKEDKPYGERKISLAGRFGKIAVAYSEK